MTDFRDKLRNPNCTLCPLHEGADFVCLMGSGAPRSDVMIIGEAPGAREDESHKTFVGQAGKLLDIALEQYADIDRSQCYVTNVAKCRPPSNRTPDLREIKSCVEAYLWDEISRVKPKFILLLGNSALRGVTKQSGIMKKAGSVWTKQLAGMPVEVMATIHPAAVLRNPKNRDMFTADIARFGRLVRGQSQGKEAATKTKIIRTTAQMKWLIHELMQAKVISYDIETYTRAAPPPFVRSNFQDWHGPDSCIVSIGFSWREGQSAVVPLWHVHTPWKDPDEALAALRPALTRKDCKYVAHNGKFDARWLHSKGIPIAQTFDTMLAAHMIEENRPKGLKPLSRTLLGADAYDVGEEVGAAFRVPLRRLCVYNGKDTDYTLRLYRIFKEQIRQDPRSAQIFMRLMMPASNALVDIERHGVWIDPERWQERHDKAQENVSKLYRYLNQYVSPELRPINLRSPPQVAKWLYGDLGLPVLEETKTGNPSTREGVILRLMAEGDHPALKALLKYRKWAKYLSTYLLPWWFEHRDENGRIHSNYKLYGTVTGRLSGEGGIQQVPRDVFIRSIIGAPAGWKFLQADYSQIELRLAAMQSQERTMLSQYLRGEDIHMIRAMRMTGKLAKDVTKEERKKAKAVNFGYVYGMGARKFVIYAFENYDVKVSLEEAEADRNGFFQDYYKLRPWHERQRRLARRYGVVYSPLGRARHLPDIMSQDKDVRAEAERQAINSPVQSMASDMMLSSLIRLHGMMHPDEAHIVGTVHDSILFEVREDCVDEYARLIKHTMEDIERIERMFKCDITVPIIADIEVGNHWAEGKEWIEQTDE